MSNYGHGTKRYLLLLLLCVVVAAQSAAFASANERHRSPEHCCLLCHAGPLPFLHTTVSVPVVPVLSVVWLESMPEFEATHDPLLVTGTSRAPPV